MPSKDTPADGAAAALAVRAYIGIGANLGDAKTTVEAAFGALETLPGTWVVERSSLFRTAPMDAGGDDYVNAVAAIDTTLSAAALLDALQAIENRHGRVRPYPNAPRTLDLDILLYGQQTVQTPLLTIPHPRLSQRAFALIPLLQIAPMITIPGEGPAHGFAPAVALQVIQRIAA
ncbi:MAG: 2-amino-4-hydroxy-6-hydroxymethyldihydropteridine diphosphokinase [Herminiimonas sp.]|nr:2-amino-4-hydroxy-6-hydroxymethyldihydropteridine diphosphokinase [Herminiimonas sp.]